MYDKTIRELQAEGYTVTLTLYPTINALTPVVTETPAQKSDTPATQPADNPVNPLTTPTVQALVDILNKVAADVSPEQARLLLGEGKTLADVDDPAGLYAQAQKVLEDSNVPF